MMIATLLQVVEQAWQVFLPCVSLPLTTTGVFNLS